VVGAVTIGADPLVNLASALGVEKAALEGVEQVDRLSGTFRVAAEAVANLRPDHFAAVLATYGDAARFQFKTGDIVDLEIVGVLDEAGLERLVADAAGAADAWYDLVIHVDKVMIGTGLGQAPGGTIVKVFFFGSVLDGYLREGPHVFERELWQQSDSRLLIAVLDSDLKITGDALSVIGGSHLQEFQQEVAKEARPGLRRVATRRNDYIGWEGDLATSLTPAHFSYSDESIRGPIGDSLDTLAVGSAAMYLCDRARLVPRDDGTAFVQAEFRGREHVAFVPIDWTNALADVAASQRAASAAVVDWCYQELPDQAGTDMAADRLPFVQTRVAQLLESRPEDRRLAGLAGAMPAIEEGVRWQWRAFIEGRITEYLGHVKELEKAVGETVTRLSDQTSALVKRLTETSLAAVAALIASFIAATFKDPFQDDLFRIGMMTYAAYVVVFPLLLGVSSTYGDARLATDAFQRQRDNLASVLGDDRVMELVGGRMDDARSRFRFWTGVVVVLYVVAAVAAVVAAVMVPDLVK
jgi:hypothetical protein